MKKLFCLALISLIMLVGCESKQVSNVEKEEVLVGNVENVDELNNVYYYNFLNNSAKKYYDLLFDASLNYSDSFTGNFAYNSDDFGEALYAFTNDYPVYYYWRNKINTIYSNLNFKTSLENKINVKENIEELINIKDQILEECIDENNYKTVKNIHDYLINSIEYDMEAKNAHNLYGALVDKRSVCDGYALAFKYLLNEAGFNSIIVSGVAINNNEKEDHAWNYVQLNNNWYLVDVTWDDQSIEGENARDARYDYFLVSDDILNVNHFKNEKYEYPKCDDMSLLYINQAGKYYPIYDKEEIIADITNWLSEGFDEFSIRFAKYEDGLAAYNDLFENKGFEEIYKKVSNNPFNIRYGGGYNHASLVLQLFYENVEN